MESKDTCVTREKCLKSGNIPNRLVPANPDRPVIGDQVRNGYVPSLTRKSETERDSFFPFAGVSGNVVSR